MPRPGRRLEKQIAEDPRADRALAALAQVLAEIARNTPTKEESASTVTDSGSETKANHHQDKEQI